MISTWRSRGTSARWKWPSATMAMALIVTLSGSSTGFAKDRGAGPSDVPDSHQFRVTTLSTQSHLVSGGDVLVQIHVPRNVPLHKASVALNGHDITGMFLRDGGARTLTGLVRGLTIGENLLEVAANGQGRGRPRQQLTLTNYPITGPILSGPHEEPFICTTESFAA